eukprot:764201-Prorocentrum_lima.AAC.1
MCGSLLALRISAPYDGASGPRTRSCHSWSTAGSGRSGGSPAMCRWAARRCPQQEPPALAACDAVMRGSVAAARQAAVRAAKILRM